MKNIRIFLSEKVNFGGKISEYLNRHVFVVCSYLWLTDLVSVSYRWYSDCCLDKEYMCYINQLINNIQYNVMLFIIVLFCQCLSALRKNAYSKYTENFTTKKKKKTWKFSDKNSDIFHISSQNIDCEYSLEPPRRVPIIYVFEQKKKKNNVYPCKPHFYNIKVGSKGVKII